jgi:hypothetical protein
MRCLLEKEYKRNKWHNIPGIEEKLSLTQKREIEKEIRNKR